MNRRVERHHIDTWVDRHYPNGIAKLSVASGVPVPSIQKIRVGSVPKKAGQRIKLSEAIGLTEDDLFPVVEDQAS
jgi:hypothetical protein